MMEHYKRFIILISVLSHSVQSYESMYDILDKRTSRRTFEPRVNNFEYSTRYRDDNRYSTFNTKPNIDYLSNDRFDIDQTRLGPASFDQPRLGLSGIEPSRYGIDSRFGIDERENRRVSTFGNGYDNLGNGISTFGARRLDREFYPSSRRDQFGQDGRLFSREGNFGRGYGGRSGLRSFDRSPDRFLESGLRRQDTPDFYRKDYFVPIARPVEEKIYNAEKKNFDNNYERTNGEQAKAGVTKIDSVISNNEDQKQKKSDAGYHSNEEGTKKDINVKEKQGETVHYDQNGENKSTIKSNKIARKGHSTKGFSTHHHKDETGNTTTYFDESSDHGGQYDFRDIADEFGNKKFTEQYNGKEDGKFFKQNGGQSENYGTGLLRNNQKSEKDIVSNNQFYDKGEKYGGSEGLEDIGVTRNLHYLHGGIGDSHHRRLGYF